MRERNLLTATVLAIAAAAGCDKDSGNGVAIEAAPAEIAKAVCPKAYTCCVASQLMGNDLAGTDEPSCEQKSTDGFKKNLDVVHSSEDKGRVVYRGDKVAACVAFLRSA